MKPICLILATLAALGLANYIDSGSQLGIVPRQQELDKETTSAPKLPAAKLSATESPVTESPAAIAAANRNKPGKSKEKKAKEHHHKHKIADLRLPCECPPTFCPKELMDKKYVCQCENAAAVACYIKSNGGCSRPSKKKC